MKGKIFPLSFTCRHVTNTTNINCFGASYVYIREHLGWGGPLGFSKTSLFFGALLIASGAYFLIRALRYTNHIKHMDLGLTSLHNFLIMGMVGACVWMATFIFAKTLKGSQLSHSTFLMFSWSWSLPHPDSRSATAPTISPTPSARR